MTRPFNAAAIPKCLDRIGKAKETLHKCRCARNFTEFSSHWAEFLIHTGSVLNALDAGANETPQGRQWYGGVKREGRNDPLISYMHQARNAEEHALHPTTANKPGGISVGGRGEDVFIRELVFSEQFFRQLAQNPQKALEGKVYNQFGQTPSVRFTPSGPRLLPVTDKFKKTYPPPTEHNGKPISDTDPLAAADHYLIYLETVVGKAKELS